MVTSLFIAMLLTQAAPPAAAPVPDDARAAIARANAEWLPAMQHQDTKAIVEPYADDAVFVDSAGVSVKGRPAIEQLMRDRFARTGRVLNATLQQDNLVVAGSMIYEWDTLRSTCRALEGQRRRDRLDATSRSGSAMKRAAGASSGTCRSATDVRPHHEEYESAKTQY